MRLFDLPDHGKQVVRLALSRIVAALRAAHAPEIRPHGKEAACLEDPGQRHRDLVLRAAAQQRMRVRHDGDRADRALGRIRQGFDAAGGAIEPDAIA
ncbi:hypothetical protein CS8_097410 [Cupriavidus sp. 8B]